MAAISNLLLSDDDLKIPFPADKELSYENIREFLVDKVIGKSYRGISRSLVKLGIQDKVVELVGDDWRVNLVDNLEQLREKMGKGETSVSLLIGDNAKLGVVTEFLWVFEYIARRVSLVSPQILFNILKKNDPKNTPFDSIITFTQPLRTKHTCITLSNYNMTKLTPEKLLEILTENIPELTLSPTFAIPEDHLTQYYELQLNSSSKNEIWRKLKKSLKGYHLIKIPQ